MTFKTTVRIKGTGTPIAGALVGANIETTGATFFRSTDGEGYADVAIIGAVPVGAPVTFFVLADGYKQDVKGDALKVTAEDQLLDIELTPFKRPSRITVVPRGPLPSFPAGEYLRELPWTPPIDRDYLRADSWGFTIPGAPWVPGASHRHPERILSWFVDRYDAAFRARYFTQYAQNGYTHLKRSAADSMGPSDRGRIPYAVDDGPPGNDLTLEQFVESCLEVKRYVPYVQVMIGSKSFQPHNMSAQQWADFADPIMDALIAAKAVDEFLLGWEWNLWNSPGAETIAAFKHAGQKAHAAGLSFWMHFSQEYTSWYADGDPRGRFGFYDDIGADVDGLNYQTGAYPGDDPILERRGQPWDLDMLQARIVDSLWQFGVAGNRHKFRLDETLAWKLWDNDTPTEDDANLYDFVGCCTIDNVRHTDAKVWGFGNGGRRPDGSAI